jgi:lysophospholipase L1-like esterase
MKKILIIGIIILSIFIIYLTTIDKKVYYVSLGDQTALGMTENGYYEKSYADYIKEYLENKNKLEKFINDFQTQGYRITDIINDINNNKEIEESNITIKNALIKADLVTISIGNNDIISKIYNIEKQKLNYNQMHKNINTVLQDLDKMLKLIKEYCKEDIIMIGIYINSDDEKTQEIIEEANEKAKEISEQNKVKYVDMYEILKKENNKKYPTKEEHKTISDSTITIINKNLLNN